jgi:hypothetical protein
MPNYANYVANRFSQARRRGEAAHTSNTSDRIGDIEAACRRALVAGARAEGAMSRQQARSSARRFVRRHRRDASYLKWVLRSVAASSALAVTLLGFGVQDDEQNHRVFSVPPRDP